MQNENIWNSLKIPRYNKMLFIITLLSIQIKVCTRNFDSLITIIIMELLLLQIFSLNVLGISRYKEITVGPENNLPFIIYGFSVVKFIKTKAEII